MQHETLDRTCQASLSAANLLRLGMNAHASELIVTIVDGVCELLQDAPPRISDPIGMILAETVAAQERGDLLREADLLEYELAPCLHEAYTMETRRAG
ncbi:MAG TPA: hypothetical protein ENJ09_04410 [Planctomycetes bacterium]|nr:hypothetical protein [Planctomycetota bacterium]